MFEYPRQTLRVAAALMALLASSQVHAQFGIPDIGGLIRQRSQQTQQPVARQPRTAGQSPAADKNSLWNEKTDRYAVIVGVEHYENSSKFSSLQNVASTASRMKASLINGGFLEENVALLISGAERGHKNGTAREPNRKNIDNQIDSMLARATDKDQVMVYLIGHGMTVKVPLPNSTELVSFSFFCPSDTPADAVSDYQVAYDHAISIKNLIQKLAAQDIGQRVLIVDACQNAAGVSPDFDVPEKFREDVWMITSCSKGEHAIVDTPAGQTEKYPMFSYHFCEALSWTSPYDDDGDGIVTIREAHRYASDRTVDESERRNHRQTPRCYAAAGLVPLVKVPASLPGRTLVTGDATLEKSLAARALARSAGSIISNGESHFSGEMIKQLRVQGHLDPSIHRDRDNVVAYAFGNYLTQAKSLAPECVDIHRVLARHHRSRGEYALALKEFQAAGQNELEVFASGRLPSRDELYAQDQNGNRVVLQDNRRLSQLIGKVSLHSKPSENANVVRMVQASRNLKITEVRSIDLPSGEKNEWLRVSHVEGDDKRSDSPAWISANNVHWFKEAAQLYLPGSDLNPDLPSVITSQQRSSEVAGNDPKLAKAQADLDKAIRIIGELQRFGLPIPGEVNASLRLARAIIAMVHAGKVQPGYQAHGAYYVSAQNAEQVKTERLRLLKEQKLDPIEERPIDVAPSPWKQASMIKLKSDDEKAD